MDTTKLSSKGQVIIPKDIRDELGWRSGEELIVSRECGRVVLEPRKPFKETTLAEVVGSAGYTGPRRSIEEMNAAVDEMFRREWAKNK